MSDPCIECPDKDHPPPECPRWPCADAMKAISRERRDIRIEHPLKCRACHGEPLAHGDYDCRGESPPEEKDG